MDEKTCRYCNKTKHISEFNKKAERKDGLSHRCKTCTADYKKNYKHRITIANTNKTSTIDKVEILEKKCSKCQMILNISNFGVDKNNKFGLRAACKKCTKESDALRRGHVSFNDVVKKYKGEKL